MDKRLIYRVVLKILFLLSLGVLSVVFINSLFTRSGDDQKPALSVVELSLEGMLKGDIRKKQWESKEVNVLRLDNHKYFIYLNVGDSGNCPLFKEANGFKDICTGTHFDFSGQQKGKEKQGFKLSTPPHFIEGNNLSIGKWKK